MWKGVGLQKIKNVYTPVLAGACVALAAWAAPQAAPWSGGASPIGVAGHLDLGSRHGGATWLGLPPAGPAASAIVAIGQMQLQPGQLGQQLQHLLLLPVPAGLLPACFSCLLACPGAFSACMLPRHPASASPFPLILAGFHEPPSLGPFFL